MKPVKVGLLGLGTVGTGVVRIVEGNQEDLSSQVGSPIVIEKIAVKNTEKERVIAVDRAKLTEDPWEVIRHPDIDVIVEVMGGIDQTKEYILEALERGKHIVTANKISWHCMVQRFWRRRRRNNVTCSMRRVLLEGFRSFVR